MVPTREDYQEALTIQDAWNLSGVVHHFNEIVSRVWEEAHEKDEGTKWVNHHPICVLFADKIASLAGVPATGEIDTASFALAFEECERMAGGETDSTNDAS